MKRILLLILSKLHNRKTYCVISTWVNQKDKIEGIFSSKRKAIKYAKKRHHNINDWIYDLPIPFEMVECHCLSVGRNILQKEHPMSCNMFGFSKEKWKKSIELYLKYSSNDMFSISVYEHDILNNFDDLLNYYDVLWIGHIEHNKIYYPPLEERLIDFRDN
jgi:hypothetical protein